MRAARSPYFTPVRRNHIVGPAGVGSLLVTKNGITVLMAGLPSWLTAVPAVGASDGDKRMHRIGRIRSNELHDHTLEHDLGLTRLMSPPALEDEPSHRTTWFLPAVRFPVSEVCHNPSCRRIVRVAPESPSVNYCNVCGKKGNRTQQLPVLLACRGGHLDEIDWAAVAHPQGVCSTDPPLTYTAGANPRAPEIRCTGCGSRGRLDAFAEVPCTGNRPWLAAASEPCSEGMQVLERTSTQTYFPDVRSALHIPAAGSLRDNVLRWLEDDLTAVSLRRAGDTGARNELLRLARQIFPDLNADSLAAHADHLADPATQSHGFAAELDALTSGVRGVHTTDGPPVLDAEVLDPSSFDPKHVGPDAPIASVVAVHRLAETRALAGFTRIDPPSRAERSIEGFALMWGHDRSVVDDHDWLPGNRVYGEGILLELSPSRVRRWEEQARRQLRPVDLRGEILDARFHLAHTLAHLLMNAAALQCGYPVASLRDRIYTADERTALLVYTSEGDIIGTMGGLVELAQPGYLEPLLTAAYANAHWCALDPVCLEPVAHIKHATAGACHQCCLLPETSCGWWNQGLDRATLTGRGSLRGYLS